MGDQSMGSPSRSDGSARSAQDPKPPEEGDEAKARSSASSPMREDGETDGDDRVVRVSNLTRIVNHKHLEEIFAHYGAVASTWVYIGWLAPHTRKKKNAKEED